MIRIAKKLSHQYCVPKDKLDAYKNKPLSLENEFKRCKNFDEIYELFKKHKTYGIGTVT